MVNAMQRKSKLAMGNDPVWSGVEETKEKKKNERPGVDAAETR